MLNRLKKIISNIPGWSTDRKIIVFESDDWGSIRMSSNESRKFLLKKGLYLDKGTGARYNRYDTLASKEDLEALFSVLTSVKDKNDAHAKITAVSLVANPDFDKIRENGFLRYEYEPFTKTLERYKRENAFDLWKEGMESGIFVPEFHGREHLNVAAWMRALNSDDKEVLLAFDYGIWGYTRKSGRGFQAAFDLEYRQDLELQKEILRDGLKLFETIHGRKAVFFVPPNGPLNNELEPVAANNGITFMSSSKIHNEVLGEGRMKKHLRHLGKKNSYGQTYITRNGFFEPTGSNKDEIDSCMSEIKLAFNWRKPAVISSHRVNYIGVLDVNNRDKSLMKLEKLLGAIVKEWPEVEFMTSSELGEIINSH